MFRKAQGLPINFIVLAALAILILILGASFVVMGGGSFASAVSPQQFVSTCQSWCSSLQTSKASVAYSDGAENLDIKDRFCAQQNTQQGNKTCLTDAPACYVTFQDGIQKRIGCLGHSASSPNG